jgi:hypothetical protein
LFRSGGDNNRGLNERADGAGDDSFLRRQFPFR